MIPNQGIVEKGEQMEVDIQMMRLTEAADAHNDKFLVQIIKCSL